MQILLHSSRLLQVWGRCTSDAAATDAVDVELPKLNRERNTVVSKDCTVQRSNGLCSIGTSASEMNLTVSAENVEQRSALDVKYQCEVLTNGRDNF